MTYKSPCPLCLCGKRNPSDLSGEPLIESNVSELHNTPTGGQGGYSEQKRVTRKGTQKSVAHP